AACVGYPPSRPHPALDLACQPRIARKVAHSRAAGPEAALDLVVAEELSDHAVLDEGGGSLTQIPGGRPDLIAGGDGRRRRCRGFSRLLPADRDPGPADTADSDTPTRCRPGRARS